MGRGREEKGEEEREFVCVVCSVHAPVTVKSISFPLLLVQSPLSYSKLPLGLEFLLILGEDGHLEPVSEGQREVRQYMSSFS